MTTHTLVDISQARAWLHSLFQEHKEQHPALKELEKKLMDQYGAHLFDWTDHFTIEEGSAEILEERGFELAFTMPTYRVFKHRQARLPLVLVVEGSTKHPVGIAMRVDDISDFLMVQGWEGCVEGSPMSPYRRCLISEKKESAFFVVERRGSRSMEPYYAPESYLDEYFTAKERWQSRLRTEEGEGIQKALLLAQELVETLGKERAAWIVLECEKRYGRFKNPSDSFQNYLGLGRAHMHNYTFRSSRKFFHFLVQLFEVLGFKRIESFYAGEEQGWGGELLTHEVCDGVVRLVVDLDPEEVYGDKREPLSEKAALGTIGLWCALQGDSILQSGPYSIE